MALATKLGSAQALCVSVAATPKAWAGWASVNETYFGCDAAVSQGLTTIQILRRIAALAGGTTILRWVDAQTTNETTTAPSPFSPTNPNDGDEDDPRPGPVGPVDLGPSSPSQVDDFLARNSDRLGDPEEAEEIRNKRQARVRDALQNGAAGLDANSYDTTPIFFTSGDVPDVSQHDLTSIGNYPSWTALHYRPAANNPAPREWYNGYEPCNDRSDAEGEACHEFPYYSSEEGGFRVGDSKERPRTEFVPPGQNSSQGGRYNSIRRCFNSTPAGQRRLLVIATPSSKRVPTVALCNGHS